MEEIECYPDKAPKVDGVLDTLSNSIRREVVHFFENFSDEDRATVTESVRHLDRRMPHIDRGVLETTLHHNHLPRLEDEGWLEYDSRSDTIRYHGHGSAMDYLYEVAGMFEK